MSPNCSLFQRFTKNCQFLRIFHFFCYSPSCTRESQLSWIIKFKYEMWPSSTRVSARQTQRGNPACQFCIATVQAPVSTGINLVLSLPNMFFLPFPGLWVIILSHHSHASILEKGPVIWLARVWSRELRWSNKSPLFYNNGTDEDRLWWWKVTALFCIYLKVIMKMDWILIERAWMAADYEQQDWCEMAVIIID